MYSFYNKEKFGYFVSTLQRLVKVDKESIMFACIGNNSILGDSLGPKIGNYLVKKIGKDKVIGTTHKSLCNAKKLIYNKNRFIIAIDSAFSKQNLKGEFFISKKPINLGEALGNNNGKIGDISIKVVVSYLNDDRIKNIENLKNIESFFIEETVEFIGNGIITALYQ